jgi:hypothetical protein
VTLTSEAALAIDNTIRHVNHMDDREKYQDLYKDHAFTYEEYNKLLTIEVSYSLAIKQAGESDYGVPTMAYAPAAKTINDIPLD